jgi:glutathione S-transferase
MILVGRYTSPFVRRVAISLRLLGLPFDRNEINPASAREQVTAINPLGRVPALVLDDGEVLIDSAAILDHLDDLVGQERALVPAAGAPRRRVLKAVALAQGVMEKSLACYIESRLRPAETLCQPLFDRFLDQARKGLAALEAMAGEDWLCEGRLTQADISMVAAIDFLALTQPGAVALDRLPRLQAVHRRTADMPAFAETHP